jgi:hypothetical protein
MPVIVCCSGAGGFGFTVSVRAGVCIVVRGSAAVACSSGCTSPTLCRSLRRLP